MNRVIKLSANDGEKKIEIVTKFTSLNGLTAWEVERKVRDLEDALFDLLQERYHVHEIKRV